jgi:hypothetical protein
MTGRLVANIAQEKQQLTVKKHFNTALLPNGNYLVKVTVNGKPSTQVFSVTH